MKLKKLWDVISNNQYFRWITEIIQLSFLILLFTYLLLFILETIWNESISKHLNLDQLFIVVVVLGISAYIIGTNTKTESIKKKGFKLAIREIVIAVLTGITGGIIVWVKTKEIGWFSPIISAIIGILIIFLAIIVFGDGDERENSQRD